MDLLKRVTSVDCKRGISKFLQCFDTVDVMGDRKRKGILPVKISHLEDLWGLDLIWSNFWEIGL